MATSSAASTGRRRHRWLNPSDLVVGLLLSAALVMFAVGAARLAAACSDRSCDVAAGVAGILVTAFTVGAAALLVGVAVTSRRGRARVSRRLLIVMASLALVAATPTETIWAAECNGHAAWAAFGLGEVAAAVDATDPRFTFTHGHTLVGCF